MRKDKATYFPVSTHYQSQLCLNRLNTQSWLTLVVKVSFVTERESLMALKQAGSLPGALMSCARQYNGTRISLCIVQFHVH